MHDKPLTVADWRRAAADLPRHREHLHAHLRGLDARDPAWIHLATPTQLDLQLDRLEALCAAEPAGALPLRGVPIAVKDNIDVGGWPTTAACPEYTRVATQDATAVARLRAAGAIVIGKTNLDQFATGLVGTRSPWGAVPNTFDPAYLCGGSSSGSASCVARGLVPLALGTDTAGSGRIPAGFNNLVGLKPTRGLIPTGGVVPACRTLDCVSVFALGVGEATLALQVAAGADPADALARARPAGSPAALRDRPRFARPAAPEFFGDDAARHAFEAALAQLARLDVDVQSIDFAPFAELAALLYAGPWVTERGFAAEPYLDAPGMDPVVRDIVRGGQGRSAHDAFAAEYRRAELAAQIAAALAGFDALVVPTAPTHYRLADIAREPQLLNSRLGTYTNFANLADLCALALPGPFRADGLPAGITLLAPAWHDEALAEFGARWEQLCALPLGATGRTGERVPLPAASDVLRIAVVGAHLRGMPLNGQLTLRGARFVAATRTAPRYRLFALPRTAPPKPGLLRVADDTGVPIDIELWDLPRGQWGAFVGDVPPPLAIGSVELPDGSWVKGFVCEPVALDGADDISAHGGWRAWLASRR
jgi:allophanate hydrolase